MDYETKAREAMEEIEDESDSVRLLGMAYIADAIAKGFKRLAKVIDNISIEVQDDE